MMRWLRVLVLLGLTEGCVVDPGAYAGRACDADHACFDGRVCQAGTCVPPSHGGVSDAGCLTWSQTTDGFASTTTGPGCAGCAVTVDASAGNRLTAVIASATDGQDIALARVSQGKLPATREGSLRGSIQHPGGGDSVSDSSPFLRLSSARGTLVELSFTNNFEINAFSGAGVLSSGPTIDTGGPRLRDGLVHSVAASWRQGSFLHVSVDGSIVFSNALAAYDDAAGEPSGLELGILGYAGSTQTGWTATLDGFELCDNPSLAP